MATIEGDTVVSYVHNAAADGMGKIGVLVALTGGDEAFGKQVAMHVAAANPASLSEADLDPAVVEKEKQVQMDIAREIGKPEAVIEKMIVGRMKKFLAEVTLLGQKFVINPDLTVAQAAEGSRRRDHRFRPPGSGRRHREVEGRLRRRSRQGRQGLKPYDNAFGEGALRSALFSLRPKTPRSTVNR